MRTIDSLSQTAINVTTAHTPDGAGVYVVLDFSSVGEYLGDDCPIVTASATLNGTPLKQVDPSGPYGCDDPPYCESEGQCRPPGWNGFFPEGFPPSADGMLTITLEDAGAPAMMVAGLDVWADTELSAIVQPTIADGAPQATLTVTPRAPYSRFDVKDATDTGGLFISLNLTSDKGEALVSPAATETPNVFQVSLPSTRELARPATAELEPLIFFDGLGARPKVSTCSGVASCGGITSSQLPPLPVYLP